MRFIEAFIEIISQQEWNSPGSGLTVLQHTQTICREKLEWLTAHRQCLESLGREGDDKVTYIFSSNPSNPCVHSCSAALALVWLGLSNISMRLNQSQVAIPFQEFISTATTTEI